MCIRSVVVHMKPMSDYYTESLDLQDVSNNSPWSLLGTYNYMEQFGEEGIKLKAKTDILMKTLLMIRKTTDTNKKLLFLVSDWIDAAMYGDNIDEDYKIYS